MKNIQFYLHLVRKRVWRHKIALHNINKAIPELEQVYLRISLRSTKLIEAIYELKMLRIQEYFEYKNAKSILKRNPLYTA